MRCIPWMILSIGIVSLAGCLGLAKEYPDKTFYVIGAEREGEPRTGVGGVLSVRSFRISPGYDTRDIVYSTGENRFESDFYHQYFLPLESMMTQSTRYWLAASGLFDSVVGVGTVVDPDLFLEGSVRRLFGDYATVTDPAAVLEIQFLLLRNEDTGPVVLLQRDYGARVALDERSPAAFVRGAGSALREILRRLEADAAARLGGGN